MDIGKMKSVEQGGPWGAFTVEAPAAPKVQAGSMWAKMSLCLGVLAVALVLELGGSAQKSQAVFAQEAAATADPEAAPLGALHLVEGSPVEKCNPPVSAQEVSFSPQDKLLGFCARDTRVSACEGGTILLVGTDGALGTYVLIEGAEGRKWAYYGLETLTVEAGTSIEAGASLGTVPPGRTVFLGIEQNGQRQDPRDLVSLLLEKQA